jgi:hypothetical protein
MTLGFQNGVGPALLLQAIGGTQTGEAGADDDHVRHLGGLRPGCSDERVNAEGKTGGAGGGDDIATRWLDLMHLAVHLAPPIQPDLAPLNFCTSRTGRAPAAGAKTFFYITSGSPEV